MAIHAHALPIIQAFHASEDPATGETGTLHQLLALPSHETLDHIDQLLQQGLPLVTLTHIERRWNLTPDELTPLLGVSRSSIYRARKTTRLTPSVSDRLYRLATTLAWAEDSIGDIKKASQWLRTTNPALNGRTPLETIRTQPGTVKVEELLARIAYGGAA